MGGGQGVGRPLALGARQGRPGGVGCCVGYSRAATTRSAGRILCEASLNVVPKHPSRRRRDWQRLVPGRWMGVGCLGVGCFWALGARQGHPRGVRSTTRPLCETLDSGHEGPYREDCNGTTAVSVLGIPAELFASVGCFGRWVRGGGEEVCRPGRRETGGERATQRPFKRWTRGRPCRAPNAQHPTPNAQKINPHGSRRQLEGYFRTTYRGALQSIPSGDLVVVALEHPTPKKHPTPNAQHPTPNTQRPTPNAQTPNARR